MVEAITSALKKVADDVVMGMRCVEDMAATSLRVRNVYIMRL